ncbi:MAG TPA: CHAP domain-containing protein [Rugosimonospora sp.]|nr:CHAP domain-containing protein [Rugosimonospora sp.]
MIASKFIRLVLAVSVATGVASVLASAPAEAGCARDPYSHACVTPARYRIPNHTTVSVQRQPRNGKAVRRIGARTTIGVICQTTSGGTMRGSGSHTWVAVTGGGWVYAPQAKLRTGGGGVIAGLRRCGATQVVSAAQPPAPAPAVTTIATSKLNPNLYPWHGQLGWAGDGYGYWQAECVSFAAWAVRSDGLPHTASTEWLGNANQWHGAYVDSTPHVGDVAQWDAYRNGAGSVGHVAYVAAVNSNGSVLLWEYNWDGFHNFHTRTVAANVPSRYLHF